MNSLNADLLIVGAGIAGLTAATELATSGLSSFLLDKGSRPGGRMATRPLDGALADYGAQFLELSSGETRPLLKDWVQQGLARPWTLVFPGEEQRATSHTLIPKHLVVGGMNQLPAALAKHLNLRTRQQVSCIRQSPRGWIAETTAGDCYAARALLLTAPIPQSVQIIESSGFALHRTDAERLSAVIYRPCFTLLARTDGPTGIPCPGGIFLDQGPLTWIADNQQKGITSISSVVTAHATTQFSESHFHTAPESVTTLLLQALKPHLSAEVRETHLHRWKYAQVVNPLPERSLTLRSLPGIFLAGDAFGGRDIDGAILSALDVARRVREYLLPAAACSSAETVSRV